jgi:DNA-binding transcriptional LysR family regulator
MDQIKALRTFARIADLGSFAGAARAMELAPSVVTRLMAELEQHLGARLLTRTTRSVTLTQIGQRYLERACRILREVDEAATAVQDEQCQPRGRVNLIAPAAFAAQQLVPRFARLHAQHPDIALDISTAAAVQTPSEACDISIVVRPGQLDGDFIAHPLASSQMLLCAAPEYLRRHGHPWRPDDLAQHALLFAVQDRLPRSWVMTTASSVGDVSAGTTAALNPGRVALSSHDAEVSRAGALAGMGIAAIPSFAVHDDLRLQRLERVLGHWRLFDMKVHACLPSRKQIPAAVRAVLNFLRAEFPASATDPWLPEDAPAHPQLRLAA